MTLMPDIFKLLMSPLFIVLPDSLVSTASLPLVRRLHVHPRSGSAAS